MENTANRLDIKVIILVVHPIRLAPYAKSCIKCHQKYKEKHMGFKIKGSAGYSIIRQQVNLGLPPAQ